jgi:small subunit ribosomal protein S20
MHADESVPAARPPILQLDDPRELLQTFAPLSRRLRRLRIDEAPMANHVSALKRARQNEKRRIRNRAGRAANRTTVRKFEAALAEGKAAEVLPEVMAQLAGSAAKGVIPKKRASRKIARLAKAAAKQG